MGRGNSDNFDYENAKRDILDAGGDPDYLSHYDREARDRYLRNTGLNPKDYGSTLGGGRADPAKRGSSWFDDPDLSDDGGCFLTTACVKAKGLPDDCEELTILRGYRDTYLKNRTGGEDDIRHYYEIAPEIVRRIDRMENAKEIWDMVYTQMILPCVGMIRQDRMEEAYELYKSCTLQLTSI